MESHLDPGWNYRIYIGLLIIPVLAICRLSWESRFQKLSFQHMHICTYAHMHICTYAHMQVIFRFQKRIFLPVKMIFSPSIRNLRYLSPCSVLANIFEFVGLAVIAYYIFGTPLPRFDTDHDGIGDDDNNVNKASPARTACPGSPQPASSQSSLAPLSLPLRFENLLIIISNFDLPFCDSNPQPHVPSIQS